MVLPVDIDLGLRFLSFITSWLHFGSVSLRDALNFFFIVSSGISLFWLVVSMLSQRN